MRIYDGGNDLNGYLNLDDGDSINLLLNSFTLNTLPSTITSSGNQMFISFTNNGGGATGKGFSASLTFGKKAHRVADNEFAS